MNMENFNLKLELEREDFEKFIMMAMTKGLTAEQLLECFINDLTYSNNTNGSDERGLANDYYNRLYYVSRCDRNSFVYFLASEYFFEFEWCKKLLKSFKNIEDDFQNQSPEDFDSPELFVKYDNLNDYYNAFFSIDEYDDYKEKFSEDAKTFEEAFTELSKFVDNRTVLPTA